MGAIGYWRAFFLAGLAIAGTTASLDSGDDRSTLLGASLLPVVEVVVDNQSNDVNGDVSTVPGLIADPGPDGISLREAIEATNADPGSYKVVFAPALAGSTVETWGFDLLGGNVHIDGDIDGDMTPDVTLASSQPHSWVRLSSSGNTVANLNLNGVGASFSTEVPGASFDGNTVSGNTFRDVAQAVVSHPSGPLVLTEWNNTWTNTVIKDNDIEATQSGIDLMFHFSIGNTFDGLTITGNTVNIPEPDGDAFGIHLSAGFWAGSTGNSFTDVAIANNVIQGRPNNPINLMTGAVGSNGNVIDGVQIFDNEIETIARQSIAERGTLSAIMLISADATTAYFDPGYVPVVAPHDNVIRNVDIARNTVSGFGGAGVYLTGAWTGDRNSITDISIRDNVIAGFLPNWGRPFAAIHVLGGEGQPDSTATEQSIQRVSIADNHIVITGNPDVADPPHTISSGGILIEGADHWAVDQEVSQIMVEGNVLDVPVPGINIIGGFREESSQNTVSMVDVFCNQVDMAPVHLLDHYPGVSGINIVGGAGEGSTSNAVQSIRVSRNKVAGVWNDVSAFDDLEGSVGGSVDWLIDDSLATDCPFVPDPGNTAPQASDATWSVAEDAAVGSQVGTVSATDPDGDGLSYAITGGNTGGAFSIENTTGAVTVATALDYETKSSYSLTITVSDGELTDTAAIGINVTDIDESPDTFIDDDNSVFEADIEWLAAQGITRGCNPPINNMFCPDQSVSRGQMAAFLTRALELPPAPSAGFVDTVGSTFANDIDRLAAAGITRGCNPPANDRFCPDDPVRREVMAAFLVRALGYTNDGGGNLFTDDDASIFESDIDKLATAGVTRGCNPPTNDRFCPGSNVTRGQMAAFLQRALG